MSDIANLSIRIDSSQAKDATKSLDALARQSKESEKAAKDYISILDKQSRLFGKTPAEVRRYESSLLSLTATQRKHADSLLTSIERQESSADAMKRITSSAKMMGIAIAAASVSTVAFVKSSIDAADELNDLSKSTGASVEMLAGLRLAADQSGVSLDEAAMGMLKFSGVVLDAANGSKGASDKIIALGMNIGEIQAKSPEKQFIALADALNKFGSDQRGVILADLLGNKFASLAPLLSEGSDELERMIERGKELNPVTAEMAKNADQFNDSLAELKMQASGLGVNIAREILPGLNRVLEQFNEGIRIAGGFGKALMMMGTMNPFKSVGSSVTDLRKEIEGLEQDKKRQAGFGSDTSSIDTALDTLKKKYEFAKMMQRQEALAGNDSLGNEARGLSATSAVSEYIKPEKPGKKGKKGKKEQGPIDVFDNASFITSSKETAKFIKEQYDVINDLQGLMADDATRAADDYAAALERLVSDTPIAKTEELYKNLEMLDEAFFRTGDERYEQAISKLLSGTEKVKEETDEMTEMAKHAGKNIQDAFADFLFDPFSGGLDGMLANFQKMLQRMAAEALASKAMSMLGDWGKSNSSEGGWVGAVASVASGLFAKADGGSVSGGGSYLVGEKGPELFTPSTDGNVTSNKEMSRAITVINNFTLSQPADRRTQEQVAAMAGASINAAMARGA